MNAADVIHESQLAGLFGVSQRLCAEVVVLCHSVDRAKGDEICERMNRASVTVLGSDAKHKKLTRGEARKVLAAHLRIMVEELEG